jgi:hypothetical protein
MYELVRPLLNLLHLECSALQNFEALLALGVGIWYLTTPSTIFQLCCGRQFYWWRKPEHPEKTTNLPQVADKTFSHKVVHQAMKCIQTHNSSNDRR